MVAVVFRGMVGWTKDDGWQFLKKPHISYHHPIRPLKPSSTPHILPTTFGAFRSEARAWAKHEKFPHLHAMIRAGTWPERSRISYPPPHIGVSTGVFAERCTLPGTCKRNRAKPADLPAFNMIAAPTQESGTHRV